MAQRQFRSDDTSSWGERYGSGSDGALTISADTTFNEANAGCSGTSGSTSLTLDAASTFANNDLVIIHQSRGTGVGIWEFNKISSGGGTTSLTMAYTLQNTYTDDGGASQAQIQKFKQYTSVTLQSGKTWDVTAWNQNQGGIMGFFCSGIVTIAGTISIKGTASGGLVGDITGKGYRGFATNTNSAPSGGKNGEGTVGNGHAQVTTANGSGGGGGGSSGSGGGGGGNGAAGTSAGGTGGSAAGSVDLTTMVFGGAGGGGGHDPGGSGLFSGNGGNGGAILVIVAPTITFTGTVVADGLKGDNSAPNFTGGGGGGGAGGSILLKGQQITLGTNLITSLGGAGGLHSDAGTDGGAGAVGRIHVDYSQTLSGTTNPTVDSRLDTSLATPGGAFLFFM